ncbi:putative Zinc finger, RING-CH-type, Zinc finger, RING/FYVE/PHD-type [Helianthus anomalus]
MATNLQDPQFDIESGGGDGTEIAVLVAEEVVEKGRLSSVSDFSVVDLGSGDSGGGCKDCRICHLSLGVNSEESENGIPIELGCCCCKHDLAAAHKHCAEAWFKIKGDRTCEICGSIARNIAGADEADVIDQWGEPNDSTSSRAAIPGQTMARTFWQGHRFLNFLLASMVFAFVISWLFHFNMGQ